MCPVCFGSGKIKIPYPSGYYRIVRCSNCSKIGCGDKSGYIRTKKNCSCSNGKSKCKIKKKKKRYIDPKLKTFFKR